MRDFWANVCVFIALFFCLGVPAFFEGIGLYWIDWLGEKMRFIYVAFFFGIIAFLLWGLWPLAIGFPVLWFLMNFFIDIIPA